MTRVPWHPQSVWARASYAYRQQGVQQGGRSHGSPCTRTGRDHVTRPTVAVSRRWLSHLLLIRMDTFASRLVKLLPSGATLLSYKPVLLTPYINPHQFNAHALPIS